MATISFTIPDAAMPRVIDALCGAYDYRDTVPGGGPNPLTRPQFAREQVRNFIRAAVAAWEAQQAGDAAAAAARAKADTEVPIT
jgi:hypothetical protein